MEDLQNRFFGIPKITRIFISLYVIFFIIIKSGFIHISHLTFDIELILKGELWRLITPFFIISDKFDVYIIFNFLFTFHMLEFLEYTYRNWLHFLWSVMIIFSSLIVTQIIFKYVGYIPGQLPVLFSSFKFVLEYIYSKRNRDQLILLAFLPIKNAYLPWIFLMFDFVNGSNMVGDLVGILIGHVVFWFEDVFPMFYHFRPLDPPKFLNNILFPTIQLNTNTNDNENDNELNVENDGNEFENENNENGFEHEE